MADYTDEDIRAIIDAFMNTAGTVQYVGARYVPTFGRLDEDSVQWDGGVAEYEPLTIVLWEGDSFTSRKTVPVGTDILNEEYWANTGNFNGQLAQIYRRISELEDPVDYQPQITALREALEQETESRTDADTSLHEEIEGEAEARGLADTSLQDAITAEETARGLADTSLQDAITAEETARGLADTALGDRIDAANDNLDVLEGALRETDASIADLRALSSRLGIGGYVSPVYEGSFVDDAQNAACVKVGNLIYTFSPNNYDSTGTVRVWNLATNSLQASYAGVVMGHGNSVAYDGTYIWLCPVNTYAAGTATRSDRIYRFSTAMANRTEFQMPFANPYGVTYDPVMERLFVIGATNSSDSISVYEFDGTDATLYATITNDQFPQGADSTVMWQDFAMLDGTLYACKIDGTVYVCSDTSDNGTPSYEVTGTLRIGGTDNSNVWKLGEVEGLEFDADGLLWNMRTFSCNFTVDGAHYPRSIGFVTSLNTSDRANVNDMTAFQTYGTISIVSPTIFKPNRYSVHSINELLCRIDPYHTIAVPSGFTYDEQKCRIMNQGCVLRVNGTMNVSEGIEVDAGIFDLYVNDGTVNFTGSGAAIDASTKAVSIGIRNNGTITQVGTPLVNTGYTPSLVAIGAMGNLTSLYVNNTEVTALGLLMGSYKVYGGNA